MERPKKEFMLNPKFVKAYSVDPQMYDNAAPIPAMRKSLSLNFQADIFFNPSKRVSYHIGDFFELLALCVYGGSLKKKMGIKTLKKENPSLIYLYPDLINLGDKTVREIKACACGNGIRFSDDKMLGYILLQLSKEVLGDFPSINFEIFKYGEYGRKKSSAINHSLGKMSMEERVAWLSKNIRFHISLPFSVVFYAYLSNNQSLVYRCEKTRNHGIPYPEAKFKSNTLNKILLNPSHTLAELGIDISPLEIIPSRSPRITINGSRINDHPVLVIKDKTPVEKWIGQLREMVNDSAKIPKNLYNELHEIDAEEELHEMDIGEILMPPSSFLKQPARTSEKQASEETSQEVSQETGIGQGEAESEEKGYPEDWDDVKLG